MTGKRSGTLVVPRPHISAAVAFWSKAPSLLRPFRQPVEHHMATRPPGLLATLPFRFFHTLLDRGKRPTPERGFDRFSSVTSPQEVRLRPFCGREALGARDSVSEVEVGLACVLLRCRPFACWPYSPKGPLGLLLSLTRQLTFGEGKDFNKFLQRVVESCVFAGIQHDFLGKKQREVT